MSEMKNAFKSLENFKKIFGDSIDEELKIQYCILFRRWDELKQLLSDKNTFEKILERKLKRPIFSKEKNTVEWVECELIFKNLIEWNLGYYNSGMNVEIDESLVDNTKELSYYTEKILGDENIFEVFFFGEQPMLNVVEYKLQKRASEKLKDPKCPNYHFVFDEVGTGKTVVSLYCIRDVVSEKHNEAKILVICPNNKKEEWEKDIKRQLGLYAHKCGNSNEDNMYIGKNKWMQFKEKETAIFIESNQYYGETNSGLNDCLNVWDNDDNGKWDLIIIDEGHLRFSHYDYLKAEKVILLSATPIIINTSQGEVSRIREFQEYIDKFRNITDSVDENNDFKDLFKENEAFTQLFREDIGIVPKVRNIKFLYSDRMEGREDFLEVLGDVKGGMTRLLYEQDDDVLLQAFYRKFREDIENKNYIVDIHPPKIENKKFEVLKNEIFNNEKSYIVFFNMTDTADIIYNKLIEELGKSKNNVNESNTVIVKKHGKGFSYFPNTATVTEENCIENMQYLISKNNKVIFITTGATGGTGLNLGSFHGIVNYEMPFTSIELEQRFGRIDRMDKQSNENKEMIFIVNNDFNPMLRFGVTKINETCKLMPIRNTVLFCPEFVKTNIESIKNEIEKNNPKKETELLSESGFEEDYKLLGEKEKKELIRVLKILSKNPDSEINYLECIVDIADKYQENWKEIVSLSIKETEIERLNKEIKQWKNLLGEQDKDKEGVLSENDIIAKMIEDSKGEISEESMFAGNEKIEFDEENIPISFDIQSIITKYRDIINIAEQILEPYKENNSSGNSQQKATGLFYIDEKGNYCKETVGEYREKHGFFRY